MRNDIIYLQKFNLKKVINKRGITCYSELKSNENEVKQEKLFLSFICNLTF